jgi:hypothetical protein
MTKEEHFLFSGASGTNIKDLDWPTGMDWKRKPIYSYMTPFSFPGEERYFYVHICNIKMYGLKELFQTER